MDEIYDYYTILGIDKNANQYEIRQKYLELSLKYHPDRNRNLDINNYLKIEEKYKSISQAFTILSDPIEKRKYDDYLLSKKRKSFFYSYNDDKCNFTVSSSLFSIINKLFSEDQLKNGKEFLKILLNFIKFNNYKCDNIPELVNSYKLFSEKKKLERENKLCNEKKKFKMENENENENEKDLHEEMKNESNEDESKDIVLNNTNKKNKKKCHPIVYDINVSLSDIYNMVPKELNVSRYRICNYCLGKGYLGCGVNMSLCHICKGLTKVINNKVFQININEPQIIFLNEGHESVEYDAGDLIININPKSDTIYKIQNQYDLIYTRNVSLIELYTKVQFDLKHLDNNNYTVYYSTINETHNKLVNKRSLRIRDLGLPIGTSGRRGDLYIKLYICLPELSNKDIEKLEESKIFDVIMHQNNNTEQIDNQILIECELPRIDL